MTFDGCTGVSSLRRPPIGAMVLLFCFLLPPKQGTLKQDIPIEVYRGHIRSVTQSVFKLGEEPAMAMGIGMNLGPRFGLLKTVFPLG